MVIRGHRLIDAHLVDRLSSGFAILLSSFTSVEMSELTWKLGTIYRQQSQNQWSQQIPKFNLLMTFGFFDKQKEI
jgi:hypothetical protein